MKLVMTIDAAKCMHCNACVMACAQRHDVLPTQARNWVRVKEPVTFQPGACMHCDNPPCIAACPTAATTKRPDGTVGIDKSLCIGCGGCVSACPYNARYIDPRIGVVDKCDYCEEARKDGLTPACVAVCPTGVRVFGDADDPASAVSLALKNTNEHSAVRPKSFDTRPTLTYLGSVADPHWPQEPRTGFTTAMSVVGNATRWLGGLSLLGVAGVFVKQLVAPSEAEEHKREGDKA